MQRGKLPRGNRCNERGERSASLGSMHPINPVERSNLATGFNLLTFHSSPVFHCLKNMYYHTLIKIKVKTPKPYNII